MSIHKTRPFLLVAVAALMLSGCGDGSSSSADSTTTTAAASRADAATVNLAKAGLLAQADLGGQWKTFREGKESDQPSSAVCLPEFEKLLATLPAGARQTGPLFQYADTTWYVGSTTNVFPDAESAKAYVEQRKSSAGIECVRARFEAEQKAGNPTLSAATTNETMVGVGTNGFELYTRYQLQHDAGSGVANANGTFDRYVYRFGNVVVSVQSDIVTGPNDPASMAEILSSSLSRAVEGSYARVPNR